MKSLKKKYQEQINEYIEKIYETDNQIKLTELELDSLNESKINIEKEYTELIESRNKFAKNELLLKEEILKLFTSFIFIPILILLLSYIFFKLGAFNFDYIKIIVMFVLSLAIIIPAQIKKIKQLEKNINRNNIDFESEMDNCYKRLEEVLKKIKEKQVIKKQFEEVIEKINASINTLAINISLLDEIKVFSNSDETRREIEINSKDGVIDVKSVSLTRKRNSK